jgi:hypothetical protein
VGDGVGFNDCLSGEDGLIDGAGAGAALGPFNKPFPMYIGLVASVSSSKYVLVVCGVGVKICRMSSLFTFVALVIDFSTGPNVPNHVRTTTIISTTFIGLNIGIVMREHQHIIFKYYFEIIGVEGWCSIFSFFANHQINIIGLKHRS